MNIREASRQNYLPNVSGPTLEQINAGSLQRIADSTELIAKNYASLIAERDRYKTWYEDARRRSKKLEGSNNALRGVITKLKAKMPKVQERQVF